jgi:hypothetical protein
MEGEAQIQQFARTSIFDNDRQFVIIGLNDRRSLREEGSLRRLNRGDGGRIVARREDGLRS